METDLKKLVGQRLQMLRNERNLTQEQMSEKLALSTSAYCKLEYGETDLTLTRLNKIAEIFNMPATELFNRIEGETNFNNCHNFIGYAEHNQTVNVGNQDDLRELVKQNSMLIASLTKRIEFLEQK